MRGYYAESLNYCCGVPEIGNWIVDDAMPPYYDATNYPEIKDFESAGCGIFVSTFLPSQGKAMAQCEKYHTLLSKTGPHKNTSGSATQEGREKGVYLCVFKFGKEGK